MSGWIDKKFARIPICLFRQRSHCHASYHQQTSLRQADDSTLCCPKYSPGLIKHLTQYDSIPLHAALSKKCNTILIAATLLDKIQYMVRFLCIFCHVYFFFFFCHTFVYLHCSPAYCYVLHHRPGEKAFCSNVYKLYRGMTVKTRLTWLDFSTTYESGPNHNWKCQIQCFCCSHSHASKWSVSPLGEKKKKRSNLGHFFLLCEHIFLLHPGLRSPKSDFCIANWLFQAPTISVWIRGNSGG